MKTNMIKTVSKLQKMSKSSSGKTRVSQLSVTLTNCESHCQHFAVMLCHGLFFLNAYNEGISVIVLCIKMS